MPDRENLYQQNKAFFANVITVYGRKPCLETLRNPALEVYRAHVASSNKRGPELAEIEALAMQRGIEIRSHSRAELARISRNGRQDQGVAVDVVCRALTQFDQWFDDWSLQQKRLCLIALDGVTNSQNLGMIIRSCCAAGVDGIVLPAKGSAGLNPLAIKASAGTIFKAPIITCPSLPNALHQLRRSNLPIYALQAGAAQNLFTTSRISSAVFVLGNESVGISSEVAAQCTQNLSIPMSNGVESLNVAVTAALVAYHVQAWQ